MKIEVQGDVALRIATLPKGAKKIEARPLALGEHSGHAHVIEPATKTGSYDLFEVDGKTYVAVGSDGAFLRHIHLPTQRQADHDPIKLDPNQVYEVILQQEFNPEADAFQRVAD